MTDDLRTYLRELEAALRLDFPDAELFIVGGTVRDTLLGVQSNDIDLMVRGVPHGEISGAFGKHGHVELTGALFGVHRFFPRNGKFLMMETSLPRKEQSVGDGHKDFVVEFDHTLPLEDDLIRRDFTINALAEKVSDGVVVGVGQSFDDLNNKVIRFVSPTSAEDDPLRMLRAIRFISKLGFRVAEDTEKQIRQNVHMLSHVSAERVQEELLKILKGDHVATALRFAQQVGILKVILPELENCVGVEQNKYHSLDVFNHIVEVVQHTETDDVIVRLAALFHDIAKPPTKWTGDDGANHFYNPMPGQKFIMEPEIYGNHEDVGADIARAVMGRLKFSSQNIDRVVALVANHMFIQGANLRRQAARKLLAKFSHVPGGLRENIDGLFALRRGDILGGKVDKVNEEYIELNNAFYKVVIAEIEKESAVTVKDLAIGGHDLMALGLEPSPRFKEILNGLLDEVIENPDLNDRDTLLSKVEAIVGQA